MTFLEPAFLWAFGLVAPLVAVYLLKVRPHRRPVTAFFLWDEVLEEKKSSALLRRLRDLLSLLLMFLALAALVFAAGRPVTATDQRDLLVVVDNSASMSATRSDGKTRLVAAKREARALLASVSERRRVALATVSDELRVQSFLSDDRRALGKALEAVRATTLPSHPRATDALAELRQLDDTLRILLISDGVGTRFSVPDGVDVLRIDPGTELQNAGFVAADIVKDAATDQLEVFFQLAATPALEEATAEVAVLRDGAPVKILEVELEDGVLDPIVTSVAGGAGHYELRVDLVDRKGDALASDDTVDAIARQPAPISVSLPDADRFFFEHAVRAFERSEGLFVLRPAPADIAVIRGVGEAPAPRLGSVVFAPGPGSEWVTSVGDPIDTPVPRLLTPDHPSLRFIPAETLMFRGAREVTLPEHAVVLVADASGSPLVWQIRPVDTDGPTGIVFNMDPASDDFFLSPYFPLLLRGTAAYLTGRSASTRSVFATGSRVVVPGLTPGSIATVAMSRAEALTSGRTEAVAFGESVRLADPGVYDVSTPTGSWALAAAPLHRGETLFREIAPPDQPEDLPRGMPLWSWLAIIALMILVAEEALYHRRRVG